MPSEAEQQEAMERAGREIMDSMFSPRGSVDD